MDRGAWWLTVHGVAKSQTQLKRLSVCARVHAHTHVCMVVVLVAALQADSLPSEPPGKPVCVSLCVCVSVCVCVCVSLNTKGEEDRRWARVALAEVQICGWPDRTECFNRFVSPAIFYSQGSEGSEELLEWKCVVC